jgi:3-methylcrotonyl-CoA carboxylase alpha subunit
LLAKLIIWAPDRAAALGRLAEALGQFEIAGVATNIDFLRALVDHPQVRRGELDTGLIERELASLAHGKPDLAPLDVAAACAAALLRDRGAEPAAQTPSPWDHMDGWMLAGSRSQPLSFRHDTGRLAAIVRYARHGLTLEFDGAAQPFAFAARTGAAFELSLGGTKEQASAAWSGRDLDLTTPRGKFKLSWIDPFAAGTGAAEVASRIVAPMPGTVARILAQPGTDVARGAPLLVLEAMKMEHTLRAPADGHLKALKCAVGDFVQEGAELADFEPAGS